MGLKSQYGGWTVVVLVIALAIVIAGAVLTLCRRRLDWQWGRRNVWSICEEWRQRLSWLWAPREEKVGLVKAQHPTAQQAVPGLYRQPGGNNSQNLVDSDTDLRLDAQGAFTRFEAVDRDLHPPLGSSNTIPPQPLRPAPQPRRIGRPRPSPIYAPSHVTSSEYLKTMHELGPLTPPPVPRLPGPASVVHRATNSVGEPSVFLFQQNASDNESLRSNSISSYKPRANGIIDNHRRFEMAQTTTAAPTTTTRMISADESMETSSLYGRTSGMNFDSNCDNDRNPRKSIENLQSGIGTDNDSALIARQLEMTSEDVPLTLRYGVPSAGKLLPSSSSSSLEVDNSIDRESSTMTIDSSCGAGNVGAVTNELNKLRHTRKRESRGVNDRVDDHYHQQQQHNYHNQHATNFEQLNCVNNTSAHRTIMESIYGPHQTMVAKLHDLQNWPNELDPRDLHDDSQSIEMTPYLKKSSSFNRDDQRDPAYSIGNSTKAQQHRVSQYIESLPDVPTALYDGIAPSDDDQAFDRHLHHQHQHHHRRQHRHEEMQSPVAPPPPAPPDVTENLVGKSSNAPTTGERIFSALRSVTSQSYIDASEFYNSVLSSAQQQVPFAFSTITGSSLSMIEPEKAHHRDNDLRTNIATGFYSSNNETRLGNVTDEGPRRGSDLYSPELNLEAHRTAQEVYNSLQDPPASPLLLRDLSQEPYSYMSDPSFTRTSEDIFNSIEQRRKSMERLNDLHDAYIEMEVGDSTRRRNSQELYAALEEVQLRRRLSQSVDDSQQSFGGSGGVWFESQQLNGGMGDLLSRRGSQGPEPEPPPDDSNLKRALSCESVCSDTSVDLGNLEDVTVVGHVCVGLEHERWGGRGADCEGDVAVSILEARDLVAPDGRPAQDTLARVCLLPERQTYVQTRLYRGSPSPSYQEKFLFPLDGGPIGRTLLVQIFSVDCSVNGGVSLLGEASLKLGPAARPPATTWLPLVTPTPNFPHHGELMFSLSYLPTAERLTLVVVKARNLSGANPPALGDFFVKVYLVQQGKKMHKKKTSAKRGEKSPIFNEAIIFSVPPHALQTIQLRLTVAEIDPTTNSKAFTVGHIIVGSTAAGKSLAHWRHMLAALRRPVAMWHPLRK